MRKSDLLTSGLIALGRHKLRAALTFLTVIFGTATLFDSIAIGIGVRKIVEDNFTKEGRLRQIEVYPDYGVPKADPAATPPKEMAKELEVTGKMDDDKKRRIRAQLERAYLVRTTGQRLTPLTDRRIREFESIPGVVEVTPDLEEFGDYTFNGQMGSGTFVGIPVKPELLQKRLEFGRDFSDDDADEAIVSEFVCYKAGLRDDEAIRSYLGKKIRLEWREADRPGMSLLRIFNADAEQLQDEELRALEKAAKQLPKAVGLLDLSEAERQALTRAVNRKRSEPEQAKRDRVYTKDLRVVGVFRGPTPEEERNTSPIDAANLGGQVRLPPKTARRIFTEIPRHDERGFNRVTVTVSRDEDLKPVTAELKSRGYRSFSLGLILQTVRLNVTLIGFAVDFIALIAIGVATLGITNTMLASVLERTREIGIMKSVGATDGQIRAMFLIEGGLIGFLGGWLGVLVGWLASIPGDRYSLKLIAEQSPPDAARPETVFLTPLWLVFGVPAFAMLITTLAAYLPARRAARIEPVEALRYE
jgi:putative ABC transport system permease protein